MTLSSMFKTTAFRVMIGGAVWLNTVRLLYSVPKNQRGADSEFTIGRYQLHKPRMRGSRRCIRTAVVR